MAVGKRGLVATSGVLWAIAAFSILRKGIPALVAEPRVLVVNAAVIIAAGFFMMFRKVSNRYTERVWALEGERFPIYKFMSPRGYLLIGIMMSMGIGFSFIPGMPQAFFAALYPGLGLGLLSGSLRFFYRSLTGNK